MKATRTGVLHVRFTMKRHRGKSALANLMADVILPQYHKKPIVYMVTQDGGSLRVTGYAATAKDDSRAVRVTGILESTRLVRGKEIGVLSRAKVEFLNAQPC